VVRLRNWGSIRRGFMSNMGVKHLIIAATVLTALAGLCVLADGQGVLHRGLATAPSTPWPANAESNVILIPSPSGNTLIPVLPPTRKPESKHQTLPPTARLLPPVAPLLVPAPLYRNAVSNMVLVPPAPSAVPPGVYRTAPYNCIVVVPGPHPDNRCIVNPGGGNSPMPIIKPDLQFIPWGPAK
jgi:hypothetical protein